MISIKREIIDLVNKALVKAFPVQTKVIVKEMTDRSDVYNFDYFCDTPKDLFDQNKMEYRRRNIFYGLANYKEVGDDIKDQIPRNNIIEKIQVTQNGTLKFRVRYEHILSLLGEYNEFTSCKSHSQLLIGLPAITLNHGEIGYDYFRALNRASLFQGILKNFKYNVKLTSPFLFVDMKNQENSQPDARFFEKYKKLFSNDFFSLNPSVQLINLNELDIAEFNVRLVEGFVDVF